MELLGSVLLIVLGVVFAILTSVPPRSPGADRACAILAMLLMFLGIAGVVAVAFGVTS